MNYTSTRNSKVTITAAGTIVKGISDEGGLYVPSKMHELKKFSSEDFMELAEKSYQELAYDVLRPFLSAFTDEEVRECTEA
ncbi:MAG: threonine synthase, partial [Oscillospiraceae bacterium]|nr:threonine synthase [Oscillospiraceae bacterium]